MDTKQAAQKWGVSRPTVQKYCRWNYVPGAVKNKAGQYTLPEKAKRPYIPKKRVNRTASDDKWDLLNVLYRDLAFPVKALGLSRRRLTDALCALRDAELIVLRDPDKAARRLRHYRLTDKGITIMENKDPRKALLHYLKQLGELAAVVKGLV